MAYNPIFNLITMGHVWDLTFYLRNGRVVVRQRHNAGGKNIRTLARMLVQTRWANCVAEWKAMMPNLKGLFCTKEPQQSDFNSFMQVNFSRSKVRLTKQEVRLGACVAEPGLTVSLGNFNEARPVGYDYNAGSERLVTDLRLGDLTLNAQTTVNDFSLALTAHNPGRFHEYDQIAILVVQQDFDVRLDIPVVMSDIFKLDLKFDDERTVYGLLGADWLVVQQVEGKNYLAFKCPEDQLLAVMHFTHLSDGSMVCSTQNLAGVNTYLANYTSEEARRKAIESYGGVNRTNIMTSTEPRPTYEEIFGDYDNSPLNPTPQQVVISTAVSPTGAGTVSGGGTYQSGAEVTLTATATDAETAPFTKWSDGVTENPRTVTATTNRTYTALFGTQQGGSTEGGGGMGEGR